MDGMTRADSVTFATARAQLRGWSSVEGTFGGGWHHRADIVSGLELYLHAAIWSEACTPCRVLQLGPAHESSLPAHQCFLSFTGMAEFCVQKLRVW